MLKIDVFGGQVFDEETSRVITINPTTLTLEHSLIAISKWESKFHVPFLDEREKSIEEIRYYIECMTITPNVDPNVYLYLPNWQIEEILEYIKDPMTATWFSDGGKSGRLGTGRKEIITSELIYYWMVTLDIDFTCEKWHINRLLTLIQVCNIKNAPETKKNRNEILKGNDALNAARRAKYNTKG